MSILKDPFVRMAAHATLGAVLGVLVGFLISFLIQTLYKFAFPGDYVAMLKNDGPVGIIPFFGMGFGAFIGGILGGVVGIRRKE